MDDIVADFVAVCRPFEVAYKLPDNIADALSATATRGSSGKRPWKRKGKSKKKAKQNNNRGSVLISFFIKSER